MVALKYRAALLTAVIVMFGATQLQARARPLIAKFTGVFQPYEKQAAGALQTLTFTNKGDSWLFLVEGLDVMGGSPKSGSMLLSRIFPPRLAISGPTKFIESLKRPDTMGKRFVLQGWLDMRVRTFRIAEVKEEPNEAQ